MAVDPATLKVVISQAIKTVSDEEKRNNLIIFISIYIAGIFLIVIIPVFLMVNPINSLNLFLSSEEQDIVKDIQSLYYIDYGMGNITINSKLGVSVK